MNESQQKILDAIALFPTPLGVIGTADTNGTPRSAVVYFKHDNDLNFYFVTQTTSKKFENLTTNPKASFLVFSEHPPKTLQIEGTAELITDEAHMQPIMDDILEISVKHNALTPLTQIRDISKKDIALVKITPTWIRLGDFNMYREGNTFVEVKK